MSQIESLRKSKIICLVLGDKPNLEVQLNQVHLRKLYPHLRSIARTDSIDLFLYTRGGDTMVPLRMVQLLRAHCKKLSILVPFRGHSAGTMVCLGAESIIMTELGELTPIDPRTMNEFNPIDPLNTKRRVPIGVEDVRAYFTLAKEQGLGKAHILEVFQKLAADIHPLALGNVERITQLIHFLSRKILATHISDESKVKSIVKALTRERYAHNYFINVAEAAEIGLPAELADEQLDPLLWELLLEYENEMGLASPFDPQQLVMSGQPAIFVLEPIAGLDDAQNATLQGQIRAFLAKLPLRAPREVEHSFDVCYIESLKRTDRDSIRTTISLVQTQTGEEVQVRPVETWQEVER